MTVETSLRSAMAEAVAHSAPDTDHLVAAARRGGLGIRRRRQLLGTVGAAAAIALAVVAPNLVASGRGASAPVPLTGGESATPTPDLSQTSPFTGRSTAAALLYAVRAQATGAAADFHGTNPEGTMPETYAFFRFTPSGSTTAGEVAINVQPGFAGADAKPGDKAVTKLTQCQEWMHRCSASRLADGSRLTTYEDRSDYQHGRGVRRVATIFRPDGVRIIVAASNGFDVTERDEQITRDEPVLTTAQLVAVVSQPWWGLRLPTYFAESGAELAPYTDASAR